MSNPEQPPADEFQEAVHALPDNSEEQQAPQPDFAQNPAFVPPTPEPEEDETEETP